MKEPNFIFLLNLERITLAEGIACLQNFSLENTSSGIEFQYGGALRFKKSTEYGFIGEDCQTVIRIVLDTLRLNKLQIKEKGMIILHSNFSLKATVNTIEFFKLFENHPLKPRLHIAIQNRLQHAKNLEEQKTSKESEEHLADSMSMVLRLVTREELERNPNIETKNFIATKSCQVAQKIWGIKDGTFAAVLRKEKKSLGLILKSGRPKSNKPA